MLRIIGAGLIMTCGVLLGRFKNVSEERDIRILGELIRGLDFMIGELEFHRPPLPTLCSFVSTKTSGVIRTYFAALDIALAEQTHSDVKSCSDSAIKSCGDISQTIKNLLFLTGESLGEFDIKGQVVQLKSLKNMVESTRVHISENHERFGKTNQTLWICAGIAIAVILF